MVPWHRGVSPLLDTFPEYLAFWERVERLPVEEQIAAWADEYMARLPELLAKQQECYSSEGDDWREVARERVFPHLGERLSAMRVARDNLLAVCVPTVERARALLGHPDLLTLVVYVGIGCGAGWSHLRRWTSPHPSPLPEGEGKGRQLGAMLSLPSLQERGQGG